MRIFLCLLVSLSIGTSYLAAAEPQWTLDDAIHIESIREVQISPESRWAVWVHVKPNKKHDEDVGNLVRLDLETGRETVLTRGNGSCAEPRWSPDGQRLSFLRSSKNGKKQVWLMDSSGGEPWPLTKSSFDVHQHAWSGPEALVFTAVETPANEEEEDDSIVVEDESKQPAARLFRMETSSKKVTPVTDNSDRIEKLVVSPDGRYAVAVHQRSLSYTYDNKIKPIIVLHDLRSGKNHRVFREAHWNLQDFQWSPDGSGFYAVNLHNSQPRFSQAGVLQLHFFDIGRLRVQSVNLAWERGLAEQEDGENKPAFAATREGFVALLANGVHHKLARYTRKGDEWRREWLTGEHAKRVFSIHAGLDGKILIYAHSNANTPTQWYRSELEGTALGKPRPFADLNPRLRKLTRARTEIVHWKGARGEEVEGILYYPHKYDPQKKYPLVAMIHGGPAAADFDAWEDWWMTPANLVCQRGAFVLKPNYHGSSNYGLGWLESITRGSYGDLETIDIEKGVDSLIERGLVDPARLALSGWSNGAILTNMLTAKTTRYRAAVSGAGNIEYVSDWGNCKFGDAFNRYYFGASPLENPLLYLVKSPFFRLSRVRTPTLILFGDKDQTVPVHQGWLHYRGLQQLGKTDVRFVLFPGEKHILTKLTHQRRKVKEEMAWLERYLFAPLP
jgi:dipeptidyl aminopeptidase/acylaminoacyl peptidase